MTCRKTFGAPFGAFVIYEAGSVDVEGTAAMWKAGPTYERCFCPTCGSRVFGREGNEIELSQGAFDEVGVFTPTYECFVVHREPWLPDMGLRQHARERT